MSLSPLDPYTSGSLPSWPPQDINASLSCLLQEKLPYPPCFMGSDSAPSSPRLNLSPPPLLSSTASKGASTAKVNKRKTRAVSKPIRVLSADTATFRDIVQKHTGIPTTSPSVPPSRHLWGGASNSWETSLPLVARPRSQNDIMAAAHQSMPKLDTSSPCLPSRYSSNNMVYNEAGKSTFINPYEANCNPSVQPALNFKLSGGTASFDPCGRVMAGRNIEGGLGGMRMVRDAQSLRQPRQMSELESLLLASSKVEDVLQSNMTDYWLPHDLLRTPSPKMEAHSS